jgi:DNA-binding response OmpR family regulator
MLPGISGTEVCRNIRSESMIPIIMLTAKSADEDKIENLTEGADDYLTKPFNSAELKARMRNLLRRSESSVPNNELKVKDLVMDKDKRTVTIKGVEIELTAKEFDILLLLITNPGKVYRREDLLELIWKDYSGDIRTVDVHIRRLRQKIELDPDKPEYVYTKWGVGYYFAQK